MSEPGTPSKPGTVALASSPRRVDEARGAEQAPGEPGEWETFPQGQDMTDIDEQELQEFMSTDLMDVGADPVFKERLRRKLWKIVRGFAAPDPKDGSDRE
jgi:hypothetical protein